MDHVTFGKTELQLPHPEDRMDRFTPAFCFTFLPGFSTVPFAFAVMPLVLRSSRKTSEDVVVISRATCRRSFLRMLAILR